MPNASGHLAIAKVVSDKLHIVDENYIKGNLIPDLAVDKVKSHYKIQGKMYMIPNIPYLQKHMDLKDKTNLGILTHLLLDKYYLEEFLPPRYPNLDVFNGPALYKDYDILNKDIVEYFHLDVDELERILSTITEEEYQPKLELNIKCLHLNETGKTTILEKDDYIKFLDEVSTKIVEEIKDYI